MGIDLLILILGPLLGVLMHFFFKKDSQKFISSTVLFSGSFLMGISLFGLLPELFEEIKWGGIWIIVGFLLQIIIEKFTGGVDHGHIHHVPKQMMVLFFGLMLHALLEGYSAGLNSVITKTYISGMIIGISIHEIPATFSLSILLKQKLKSKQLIYFLLLTYVLSTSIGYLMGHFIKKEELISEQFSIAITGIIAGTFLHISTLIVFEQSLWKKEGLKKWFLIIVGLTISFIACKIG